MMGEAQISGSGFYVLESGLAGSLKHLYALGACAEVLSLRKQNSGVEQDLMFCPSFLLAQDLKAKTKAHAPAVVG